MKHFHPLHTDIPKPERCTYPFCYEPHPLCLLAAEEVKREIERISPREGKMYGVLIVETQPDGGELGFFAAYSGLLEGRNDWDYFVPPVFDAQMPDGYFKSKEREISALKAQIAESMASDTERAWQLTAQRKQMSEELQQWLFHQYQLLNGRGEQKDLVDVWQDYHCSPRIRKRYPMPPGGTGDCCAPKLLQYAYLQGMKPLCMAEFWWGPQPRSEYQPGDHEAGMVRHHGQFYPACRGKCKPLLTWMLQGLAVDPNPEEAGFPHLKVDIVYEDEAIAVINKPSGMLSIPGRAETYSVATWAKERWKDAIPAHRLDMWTQGIMIIAKTKEAFVNLQEQFTARTVKKKYLAIVEGTPGQEHGIIDLPLLCDPLNRPRQIVDRERGKRAITEFRVIKQFELPIQSGSPSANHYTLLALWPHTGRTHQLRMHCAHKEGLGCPILGDELYGHHHSREEQPHADLCLQAQAISFAHPTTGVKMRFELPYPFGNLAPYNNK